MSNVKVAVHGNSADITFNPVDAAKDYRVYVMPDPSNIMIDANGKLAGVHGAIYRCAGNKASPPILVEGYAPSNVTNADPAFWPGWAYTTSVTDGLSPGAGYTRYDFNSGVESYNRSAAEALLGYVYLSDPGDGKNVPVYAVGNPALLADNYGGGFRFQATRAKIYLTDFNQYIAYIVAGWRDDGIAFYVPLSSSGATTQLYLRSTSPSYNAPVSSPMYLYYTSAGGERTFRSDTNGYMAKNSTEKAAFPIYTSQIAGTQPLKRVFYRIAAPGAKLGAQGGHDELAVGEARFDQLRFQGLHPAPMPELHWSGITSSTQLVVEALDSGCPFQGLLGANSVAAGLTLDTEDETNMVPNQMDDRIFTLGELQKTTKTAEVYVNGQFDGVGTPHPIARTVISVAPVARPAMDFATDFANQSETFVRTLNANGLPDCGTAIGTSCYGIGNRSFSKDYELLYLGDFENRESVGTTLGELWTLVESSLGGGKFRIAPKAPPQATLSDTSFLHVVMEADLFSSGRRYPQIFISDANFETSQLMMQTTASGAVSKTPHRTILIQPIDSAIGRPIVEVEVCQNRNWEVNDQCPWFVPEKTSQGFAPYGDLFDHMQDDHIGRFDVYASTKKLYIYLDNQPYGCVDFSRAGGISPLPLPPVAGNVSVAWGDVQYHAGAEDSYFTVYSPFHENHMRWESTRHFDYMGYSSGVSAPAWDETKNPCTSQMFNMSSGGTQNPEL